MSTRKNGADTMPRTDGKAVSPALARSVALHLEGKRKEALRELNTAIEGLTAGQAIAVLGEPGIGKSALLAAAETKARAAGFRTLSATGIEAGARLESA